MQTVKSKSYIAARIVSTLFVPPSLTIIIFTFFAFYYEQSVTELLTVLCVAYSFGFIFPIIMFIYLRKKGKIIDQDASLKEERTVPFFIAVMMYAAGFLILVYSGANAITSSFWFCYISNTLIVILINKYWKISAHALGISGPLAAITYALGVKGFVFIFLLFIVGWSRIRLKRHTLLQVIAGGVLGFVLTYFQMSIIAGKFIK
ncbi:MAG: phosphatase PAP2 family protein [Bacillota bacterium]